MNKENVESLKKQVCHLGNSAHSIRNIISQHESETVPETIILGDVCGRIEDACKDMMRTSLHFKYLSYFESWKVVVCRIRRHVVIAKRIVGMSSENGYESFSNESMKLLNEHLQFQENVINNIDAYLNKMFIEFSGSSAKGFSFESDLSSSLPLFNVVDFAVLPGSMKQITDQLDSLSALVSVASESSNLAHEVQNIACKYQMKKGFEDPANRVFGAAGEVENYARQILRIAKQHTHNIQEMKDIIYNLSTQMEMCTKRMLDGEIQLKTANDYNREDDIEHVCKKVQEYSQKLQQVPLNVLVEAYA